MNKKLESFRHDRIGIPYFSLSTAERDISQYVHAVYIDYSFRAFYLTMQDIQELEYTKGDLVPDGRNSIIAVSLWFLSLESYINTLLKITCQHTRINFEQYKSKRVAEKLTSLLELLKVDSVQIKRTGLYSRINEFTTFRNEIFHDRNIGKPLEFQKTLFSQTPIQCNLIDTLQGLLIYLEVLLTLRYALKGLDTMPDILINEDNKVFCKKLDFLHKEVIAPSMKGILAKHELHTDLDINTPSAIRIDSETFNAKDVRAFFIADSPNEYKYNLNPISSNISYSLFHKIVSEEQIGPEHFKIGKYTLD